MSRLISSAPEAAKRRSLRVAAIIAVPLAGLAALAGVSSDVRFLAASVAPASGNWSGWNGASRRPVPSAFSSQHPVLSHGEAGAAPSALSLSTSHEHPSERAGSALPHLP